MEKFPLLHTESMNSVLVQEMERFNRLVNTIRCSLNVLLRAMKGLAVMSPVLEAICSSLVAGEVPASWAKVSYPSLKPLASYVADLLERLKFLEVRNYREFIQLIYLMKFHSLRGLTDKNRAQKYSHPLAMGCNISDVACCEMTIGWTSSGRNCCVIRGSFWL